jgi:hypothetical protein
MDLLNHKLYYINSRNKNGGTHSNMSYSLDLRGIKANRVVVMQANIPKSYYMVQQNLNTFTLIENDVDITVTIPEGNYNRTNFKSTLQSLLNGATLNTFTYAVSVPLSSGSDTGKYTFTVSNNGVSQPSLSFSNSNNMYELMGFNGPSINIFIANALVSTNVIKLQKEDTLFIRSDIVSGHSNGILQDLNAINSVDFDNIVFQNYNPFIYAKPLNGSLSNVFSFQIVNEDGNEMNLNGNNWTMTICIFQENELYKLLKTYIDYRLIKK